MDQDSNQKTTGDLDAEALNDEFQATNVQRSDDFRPIEPKEVAVDETAAQPSQEGVLPTADEPDTPRGNQPSAEDTNREITNRLQEHTARNSDSQLVAELLVIKAIEENISLPYYKLWRKEANAYFKINCIHDRRRRQILEKS